MKADVKMTGNGLTVTVTGENEAERFILEMCEGRTVPVRKAGSGVALDIELKQKPYSSSSSSWRS